MKTGTTRSVSLPDIFDKENDVVTVTVIKGATANFLDLFVTRREFDDSIEAASLTIRPLTNKHAGSYTVALMLTDSNPVNPKSSVMTIAFTVLEDPSLDPPIPPTNSTDTSGANSTGETSGENGNNPSYSSEVTIFSAKIQSIDSAGLVTLYFEQDLLPYQVSQINGEVLEIWVNHPNYQLSQARRKLEAVGVMDSKQGPLVRANQGFQWQAI